MSFSFVSPPERHDGLRREEVPVLLDEALGAVLYVRGVVPDGEVRRGLRVLKWIYSKGAVKLQSEFDEEQFVANYINLSSRNGLSKKATYNYFRFRLQVFMLASFYLRHRRKRSLIFLHVTRPSARGCRISTIFFSFTWRYAGLEERLACSLAVSVRSLDDGNLDSSSGKDEKHWKQTQTLIEQGAIRGSP